MTKPFTRIKIPGIRRKRHSSLFVLYAVLTITSLATIWMYFQTSTSSNLLVLFSLVSISIIFVCCLLIALILKQQVLPQIASIISLVVLFVIFVFMLQSQAARPMKPTNSRNDTIVAALEARNVSYLLGDFWKVSAIGNDLQTNTIILPTHKCTQLNKPLGQRNVKPVKDNSFAYILTLDNATGHQNGCTISSIEKAFGVPNSSIVIAGTPTKPKELLLFYDKYAAQNPNDQTSSSSINKHSLSVRKPASCQSKTVLSFVAHEDDDLLFMNPDLSSRIRNGYCVTTLYMTAGDSGTDPFYWVRRRQGSEAAYNVMLGRPADQSWTERIVQLAPKQYVTIANPVDNQQISLIFVNLPDGNVRGSGFERTNNQSLSKLWDGQIATINSIDEQSVFNSRQLTSLMTTMLRTYSPEEVWTSSYGEANTNDHSDHITIGRYTARALAQYNAFGINTPPVTRYFIGYPIRNLPPNLTEDEVNQKAAIFFTYASYDAYICPEQEPCLQVGTYEDYLYRQYVDSKL